MFIDEGPQWPQDFGQPAVNGKCPDGLTAVTTEIQSEWTWVEEQIYCVSAAKSDAQLAAENTVYSAMSPLESIMFAALGGFLVAVAIGLIWRGLRWGARALMRRRD